MTTTLDRRAEAAAAAVRAAVTDLEPAAGATPHVPRRRWPALVAAVVLLVAAVGGAAVLEDDDGDAVVAGPGGALPRLVVDDLPDGFQPAGASEGPAEGSISTTFRLYGRGDSSDPFGEGDLAVLASDREMGLATTEGDVQVRGVPGTWLDPAGGGRMLNWNEPGLGSVMVGSRSLDEDRLLAVAEGLRRDGADLVVDSPPDGYTQLADLGGMPSPGLSSGIVAGDSGSTVLYQDAELTRFLAMTVNPAGSGVVEIFRWLGGDGTQPTTVRGHDGWLLPVEGGVEGAVPTTAVGWHEAPGVFVTVTGAGVPEAEVRRAAESVREATDDEWDDLLATSWALGDPEMPTLAEGVGRGPSWRYARDGDEGVCFEVTTPPVSGTCYSGDPQLSEGAEQVDAGWWLHGRVAGDVRRISVQVDGGEPVVEETVPMTVGHLRAWAYLAPPETRSAAIVALDDEGREVDRATVELP